MYFQFWRVQLILHYTLHQTYLDLVTQRGLDTGQRGLEPSLAPPPYFCTYGSISDDIS